MIPYFFARKVEFDYTFANPSNGGAAHSSPTSVEPRARRFRHERKESTMKSYTATYFLHNPKFNNGGCKVTRKIKADCATDAHENARKVGDSYCGDGWMELLNVQENGRCMTVREYAKSIDFEIVGKLKRLPDVRYTGGDFCPLWVDEAGNEYLGSYIEDGYNIFTADGGVI